MIQYAAFTFEKLPANNGNYWVHFARFGRMLSCNFEQVDNWRDFPSLLSPEKTYQISIDQSSSVAGVFIKDTENTEAYMIEVSRDKKRGQDADDFIFNFELFINYLTEHSIFTHLIYERPISSENYRSSQVLFQLEGNIRAWVRRYSQFKSACLDNIENTAWRGAVIIKAYEKKYSRKEASQESIREMFPWSCRYMFCLGPDYDVYEAMGVMFGWFFCSFDGLGRPYVRGDKFNGNIGGFFLPGVGSEEIAEQLKQFGIDVNWKVQNPRKSIYENIASAVEKYRVVCVELTDKFAMLSLAVECNFKWTDPDKATVLLVASNFVDNKLFEITGNTYHFIF